MGETPNGPEPPCPSGVFWIVEPGDTLWLIARKTGTSVEDLIKANPGVDPLNLKINSKICIPASK